MRLRRHRDRPFQGLRADGHLSSLQRRLRLPRAGAAEWKRGSCPAHERLSRRAAARENRRQFSRLSRRRGGARDGDFAEPERHRRNQGALTGTVQPKILGNGRRRSSPGGSGQNEGGCGQGAVGQGQSLKAKAQEKLQFSKPQGAPGKRVIGSSFTSAGTYRDMRSVKQALEKVFTTSNARLESCP